MKTALSTTLGLTALMMTSFNTSYAEDITLTDDSRAQITSQFEAMKAELMVLREKVKTARSDWDQLPGTDKIEQMKTYRAEKRAIKEGYSDYRAAFKALKKEEMSAKKAAWDSLSDEEKAEIRQKHHDFRESIRDLDGDEKQTAIEAFRAENPNTFFGHKMKRKMEKRGNRMEGRYDRALENNNQERAERYERRMERGERRQDRFRNWFQGGRN